MRRLWITPGLRESNLRELAEHEEIMAAIKRDRLRTSPRPIAPGRPALFPQRRVSPAPARRPVAYADGSPATVCQICHGVAHVNTSWRCETCQAEVRWRVALARQGLRIIS